jgi:triacylglycerol lipase
MNAVEFSLNAGAGNPFSEDPSLQMAATPIWREAMFPLDWMALRSSPVYYGCGIPAGEGEPVVVVPGFLASDLSMTELYWWLARIGYRPYFSNVGHNADCPDHVASLLLETIRRAYRDTGQRVRVVGHSLGGMLGRHVALDYPEYVNLVISMGSPFKDAVKAHPLLHAATESLRGVHGRHVAKNVKPSCFSGHCTCSFVKNMIAPEEYEVAHFAIYSKRDGVVDWENCIEDDASLNDEVNCTHLGMAFHPGVYRVLASRLRQAAEGHHEPGY